MKLDKLEQKTFVLLLQVAFFTGFVNSASQIQDIIAKKALHALDWQITLLVMLWPISNLFSIYWGKVLEQSKSIAKYLMISGFVGRLILIFMLWVNNYYEYLFILTIFFSFNGLIIPATNSIYQHNIRNANRGVMFGYAASLTTLITLLGSYLAGRVLDADENWFRVFFAIVGVLGCYSSFLLALIKVEKKNFDPSTRIDLKKLFISPVLRAFEVMKKNRNFSIFQRNFFIYGIGFLIIVPVIPKYLVEILKMSYTSSFVGKAVITQIPILILAPIAGKVFDKKNPANFSSIAFASLSLYPLLLFISSFFIGSTIAVFLTYFAFLMYGIAMSGILISWSISSNYFAGNEDAAMYQSVHVTLTGVRGLIVPVLGFIIMKYLGVRAVFIVSICFLLTASFLSFKLYLSMDKKEFRFDEKAKRLFRYFRKLFPFGG